MSDYAPYVPEVPESRLEDEKAERNAIASSVAILEEFFTDLDKDIEDLRGMDFIDGVNPSTKPEDLLKAVLSNQTSRELLIKLRDKYKSKYAQYLDQEREDES